MIMICDYADHGDCFNFLSIITSDAAGGSVMDYVYGKLGVKLSFSLELRGDSTMINFLLPPDQIQPTGEEVFAAILKAAENVN